MKTLQSEEGFTIRNAAQSVRLQASGEFSNIAAAGRSFGNARRLVAANIASCRRAVDLEREGVPGISVIIPTLNEADSLVETVRRAKASPEVSEVIVVDAGSQDRTKAVAEELGCRVVNGPRSRGGQLRLGAAQATGDVVLLLHADTWLPPNAGRAALECLSGDSVVAGGFWKAFRDPHALMRGSRLRCGLRLWFCRRVMGDQAMFVRRDRLEQIGGVPDVPLMEEFELCRRLRRVGRLALARATVTTSARRFHQHGVLRTYWRMWSVTIRYWLGASPEELRKRYERP